MRSFMQYVSCCFATPEGSMGEEALLAETTPKKEETKSSMPSHRVAVPRMKNRVRVRITRPMNPHWKPSLFAIMEDNVTPDKRVKTPPEATTPVVDRVGKGKSCKRSRSKVKVGNKCNDTRTKPVSFMSLPTFAPSPFMF